MNMEPMEVLSHFALSGAALDCSPYGNGHINATFLARTTAGRYILQRISARAFADIPGLMDNIAAVTAHLRQKDPDPRHSLRLIPTREGGWFWREEDGECWRCTAFVEGSRTPLALLSPAEFREIGGAWGRFLALLSDFPVDALRRTGPCYHDAPERYRQFRAALENDPLDRAGALGSEIEGYLFRETDAAQLQTLLDAGELPLRLTHNDTKMDNILLDTATGRALCVLDLDTVMPGLIAYDFGDAVRSQAVNGRGCVDTQMLSAFAGGFLGAYPELTRPERESLALGVWTMTVECGLRYLTDYLEGERFFAVRRPGQCLERARAHLRLARDMERRRGEMERSI